MKSHHIFLLLLLTTTALAFNAPLQKRYDGYKIGSPTAPVMMEMFADFGCVDCGSAWPTIQKVIETYCPSNKVHFIYHTFPLPYHQFGFDSNMAAVSVWEIANAQGKDADAEFFKMGNILFKNQAQFFNDATFNKTQSQLYDQFADYASQLGYEKGQFLNMMQSEVANFKVRYSWKYAASRGVFGTPNFFINGVGVDADDSWSFSQWKNLLDPLLN